MAHSVHFEFTSFHLYRLKVFSAIYTNYNRPNKEVMN